MFKTRLISGMILVLLALVFIITGQEALLFLTMGISCIGQFELYRVFKLEKSLPALAGYAATVAYYCSMEWKFLPDSILLFMGFLILLLFAFVFSYPDYHTNQILAVFFGFFYVAVMLSFVYRLRMLENGLYLAFLVFLCSWGCDTCAYCVGKLFGKHQMSPKLSPKKSVEGAAGGVAGAAGLTALYCLAFQEPMGLTAGEIGILALIAAIAGLISMVGDLAASAIKRNYDIKDYGHLIPGHGGILDRFDSMIITAPIIYYLAVYLMP